MQLNKPTIGALIALGVIGFIDSLFLTIAHYKNFAPPCSLQGCEVVTTSAYSAVFGIPISLFGALFYLVVLVLMIAYIDRKKDIFISLVAGVTLIAGITSLYLIYLQLFVLKAICIYCMTADIITLLLAIISNTIVIRFYRKLRKNSSVAL